MYGETSFHFWANALLQRIYYTSSLGRIPKIYTMLDQQLLTARKNLLGVIMTYAYIGDVHWANVWRMA